MFVLTCRPQTFESFSPQANLFLKNIYIFCPGIVDYMSEQAGPPSKQVQALKQIQELLKDGDDAVIIGVFSSEEDALYEIYQEACKYRFFCFLCLC